MKSVALTISISSIFFLISISSAEIVRDEYYSQNEYYDQHRQDSPYNLCRNPLLRISNVSATSEASQRYENVIFDQS